MKAFAKGDRVIYVGLLDAEEYPRWGGRFGKISGTVMYVGNSAINVTWKNGLSSCAAPRSLKLLDNPHHSHPLTQIFKDI